jgi:hypothetical protein
MELFYVLPRGSSALRRPLFDTTVDVLANNGSDDTDDDSMESAWSQDIDSCLFVCFYCCCLLSCM